MLHLARKAFFPATPPFRCCTSTRPGNSRRCTRMRERAAKESGMQLLVHVNPEARRRASTPSITGPCNRYVEDRGTQAGARQYRLTPRSAGAPRRGEESRKERVSAFARQSCWDPKSQRPNYGICITRGKPRESLRVFPLSNWTELDIWQYIHLEKIPIVPLYLAAPRPTVIRDGPHLDVDDDRFPLKPGEVPVRRSIRFRTLAAIRSRERSRARATLVEVTARCC